MTARPNLTPAAGVGAAEKSQVAVINTGQFAQRHNVRQQTAEEFALQALNNVGAQAATVDGMFQAAILLESLCHAMGARPGLKNMRTAASHISKAIAEIEQVQSEYDHKPCDGQGCMACNFTGITQ